MTLSARILSTEPPPLTPLMAEASRRRARGEALHVLAQAAVDYPPPAAFLRALQEAAAEGFSDLHGYTPDPGRPDLRRALAGYLDQNFGIHADPEREILVTPGANHAAFTALATLLSEGDEVLLIAPYYFNHAMSITALGGCCRCVTAPAHGGFLPKIADLTRAWTPRTRALILVTPNNPTGVCYPHAYLTDLADRLAADARWERVWILCDQTYQEIYFAGQRPLSLAALPALRERVLTIGSFSKSMALAGWRLGFLAGPSGFLESSLKIQDSSVICAANAAQWALAETLRDAPARESYFAEKRTILRARRDALLGPLCDDTRLTVVEPDGACFAFVGLPDGREATPFARDLLERAGIVVVPGRPFGDAFGSYIRLSFGSGSVEGLRAAGERLADYLRTI
jgi:aspartate/methionine/tyrosine aminotransferase